MHRFDRNDALENSRSEFWVWAKPSKNSLVPRCAAQPRVRSTHHLEGRPRCRPLTRVRLVHRTSSRAQTQLGSQSRPSHLRRVRTWVFALDKILLDASLASPSHQFDRTRLRIEKGKTVPNHRKSGSNEMIKCSSCDAAIFRVHRRWWERLLLAKWAGQCERCQRRVLRWTHPL